MKTKQGLNDSYKVIIFLRSVPCAVAGADLLREKYTIDWLVAAGWC